MEREQEQLAEEEAQAGGMGNLDALSKKQIFDTKAAFRWGGLNAQSAGLGGCLWIGACGGLLWGAKHCRAVYIKAPRCRLWALLPGFFSPGFSSPRDLCAPAPFPGLPPRSLCRRRLVNEMEEIFKAQVRGAGFVCGLESCYPRGAAGCSCQPPPARPCPASEMAFCRPVQPLLLLPI